MRLSATGRTARLTLVAVVGLALVAAAPADPRGGDARAVRDLIHVELELLEGERSRFEGQRGKRSEIADRAKRIRAALDLAAREPDVDAAWLASLVEQLGRAEAERDAVLTAERATMGRIRRRAERVRLLEVELAGLEPTEEAAGPLTGTWEISVTASGLKGTWELEQSGVLVSGRYEFESGSRGSLQGTMVDGRVHLVRIDSRRGKSMELDGRLSADGRSLRGSFMNYELAGVEPSSGQWTARRRVSGN